MAVQIELKGLEKIMDKLEFLPTFQAGIHAGTLWVKAMIAQYPPRVLGRKQPPKTRKQWAFLRWAIPNKVIDFPYRRGMSGGSQALGRKWTTKFEDRGKTGVVGNNVSYGPFVQGDKQSAFHRAGGWKTTREVAQDEAEKVRAYVLNAIRDHLRR